jgi:hypothetical protein
MTEIQRSDAKTLMERQYYFVKVHLRILPAYFFISQLDTPLSNDNPMTLRRAMMAKAPAKKPTGRLIHNVDPSWNNPSKHTITTVVGREVEAQRFLVNMIPEFLYKFGDRATIWFTTPGLLIYQDVKWNPAKRTTSSSKERDSEEMVQEDLWELNKEWEKIKLTPNKSSRPDDSKLNPANPNSPPATATNTVPTGLQARLASDKSIASFGNAYNLHYAEKQLKVYDESNCEL